MSTVESTSAWAQTLSSISSALSTHLQDKMLKKMDTDSSGGVDQTEFKAALEKVAGKLGVDAGEGAEELYASLDADSDGSLNGSEVGQLLQQLFTPPSDTQAFVQSRGDEARFAELDADADGQISMAEFGITPEATMVSTTTTTTTVVSTIHEPITGTEGTTAVAAATPEAAAAASAVDTAATATEAESTAVAQAAVSDEQLQAMMSSVDANSDGEISGAELSAFVAQISAQAEAATRRYNETALASAGTTKPGTLNATA